MACFKKRSSKKGCLQPAACASSLAAVSPGLTDTPLICGIFGDAASEKLYADTARSLPARYVAKAKGIAQSYVYLLILKFSLIRIC
jgi:hypothetical protein